jgi:hypothetical protein
VCGTESVEGLRSQLTPPREKSLNLLLRTYEEPGSGALLFRHAGIVNALDSVLEKIPGMRVGCQFGNWHKHIAEHCDEQIEHYIAKRILDT